MSWFMNLRISTKLMLQSGGLILFALILGFTALGGLQVLHKIDTELAEDWLPSVAAVGTLNSEMQSFRRAQLLLVLSHDEATRARNRERLLANAASFESARRSFEALLSGADERQVYEGMMGLWKEFLHEHEGLLALVDAGKLQEAQDAAMGNSAVVFVKISNQLQELVKINTSGAKNAVDTAAATFAKVRYTIIAVMVVATVLGVALSLFLARVIAAPLAAAVQVAKQVAAGDLSARIEARTSEETGQLLAALHEMNESLTTIVAEVRQRSDHIATSSEEIARGNLDLSARTEAQAGSLEETAASMEELTGTVRHNGDNARQANQLAAKASDVAVRGGEIVARVVGTMGAINDSSRRIADIIGVIDSIAFQTNILALNAAVEAARAGEQGRGFAVVAAEVRTLAQRSAAAAKDIKHLIDDSVERIASGSKLVDDAGTTMDEIVASVHQVSDIIAEIAASAGEQTQGIEQVNQAVVGMDSATQQNAALVEEAAAASQSMRDQAGALTRAVAVFRLAG